MRLRWPEVGKSTKRAQQDTSWKMQRASDCRWSDKRDIMWHAVMCASGYELLVFTTMPILDISAAASCWPTF